MANYTTPVDFSSLAPSSVVEPPKQNVLIGFGLAISGNLLISISLNVQKYTHNQNEANPNASHYLRSPLWWFGMILMMLGELGNFSAYGFAPASLVAPLGTTTVVANMFIAVIYLKERLRPEDIFGCVLAVIGSFLLVRFSQENEAILGADELFEHLLETSFIVYAVIEISAIVVLLVMKYSLDINSVLVLLLITALLASFTVISAKAVSGMIQLTFAGEMQIDKVIFYMMLVTLAVTCIVQIKYLNQAMMAYDSTVVVPTNFVFFTISAIVAGIIFYKEFFGMQALNIIMFMFGCLLCFCGVYFITAGRSSVSSGRTLKERFLDFILPSWLLERINSMKKSDVVPIVSNSTEQAYSENGGQTNEPLHGDSTNGRTYGTTEPP